MVRSPSFLSVTDSSQIQLESKREEAAACFYRALKIFPEVEDQIGDLSDLTGTTIPRPVVDIFLKMMARDPERNNQNQFPTDIEEKEAFFFQETARGEALSKDQDLDGSFIHTASRDR